MPVADASTRASVPVIAHSPRRRVGDRPAAHGGPAGRPESPASLRRTPVCGGLVLYALGDDAIDVIAEHAWRFTSPFSFTLLSHMGGAIRARSDDEMAFTGR